jgi:hypothetical protein
MARCGAQDEVVKARDKGFRGTFGRLGEVDFDRRWEAARRLEGQTYC